MFNGEEAINRGRAQAGPYHIWCNLLESMTQGDAPIQKPARTKSQKEGNLSMKKRIFQLGILSMLFLVAIAIGPRSVAVAAASSGPKTPVVASVTNPYSPAYQHSYRHGVVPTVAQLAKIKSYQQVKSNAVTATSANTLTYQGGVDGIGVTSGTPKVYLVFWGNQWGKETTKSGQLTFSNDSAGAATRLQNMFKGLGTGNELWSGTMTQYCDGPGMTGGRITCSANANHVGYPTGGALAGTWYDNSTAEPSTANGNQLADEAVSAAAHFGNKTAASNRYTQYVILSPKGLDPDNYQINGFCAWHDYTGDTGLSGGAGTSPYGDIAFTNMPYVLDAGTGCGENFVNAGSAGKLDGFTIVEGHEYAETVTDQNPVGGWFNTSNSEESGDECAWITPGSVGGSGNVKMGNGSYPLQTIWSNDTNSCALSHPIVGSGPAANDFALGINPPTFALSAEASATSNISTALTHGTAGTVNLSLVGTLPTGITVSFTATSVKVGSSANVTIATSASVPTGRQVITFSGSEGSVTHTIAITLSILAPNGGLTNGGFEQGLFAWSTYATDSVSSTAHSGSFSAEVGDPFSLDDNSINQTFTAPTGAKTLSFWYLGVCPSLQVVADWASASLQDNTTGVTTTVLPNTCTNNNTWVHVTTSITANHSYLLRLSTHDDDFGSASTYTFYDDVTIS